MNENFPEKLIPVLPVQEPLEKKKKKKKRRRRRRRRRRRKRGRRRRRMRGRAVDYWTLSF